MDETRRKRMQRAEEEVKSRLVLSQLLSNACKQSPRGDDSEQWKEWFLKLEHHLQECKKRCRSQEALIEKMVERARHFQEKEFHVYRDWLKKISLEMEEMATVVKMVQRVRREEAKVREMWNHSSMWMRQMLDVESSFVDSGEALQSLEKDLTVVESIQLTLEKRLSLLEQYQYKFQRTLVKIEHKLKEICREYQPDPEIECILPDKLEGQLSGIGDRVDGIYDRIRGLGSQVAGKDSRGDVVYEVMDEHLASLLP